MTTPTTEDVYIYRSRDPHTAIPDWLAFYRNISSEARALAHAIIVMSKGPLPPTKPEIAKALGVDVRSVYRWLGELNAAGVMSARTVGRRNLYVFTEPSNSDRLDQMTNGSDDQPITDRLDQMTNGSSDRLVRHDPHDRDQFLAQQDAANPAFSENRISDPLHGGGGSSFSSEKDSPLATNPRRKISPHEITGATGKWMVAETFSLEKAFLHQHLPLAAAQADFQRRRQAGQFQGAIALAWEVAPPAGDSSAAPLEPSSGEFTFSEREKERYRAMGFAFGSEMPESEESK